MDEHELENLVRSVLLRTLGQTGTADSRATALQRRPLVTEATIAAAPPHSTIPLASGTMVTPLARQAALERDVTLQEGPSRAPRPSAADNVVALGADHGGYSLKEALKAYVVELGFQPADCGTNSTDAVDYPDFAYAVAQMVAEGRAARGIVVDGAGIGSCMAANKVPGVRAVLCYDLSSAMNSREHNNANVLTLGSGLIGANLARQIVKTWLETPFGGGRHERRVQKIMEIERRFSRR